MTKQTTAYKEKEKRNDLFKLRKGNSKGRLNGRIIPVKTILLVSAVIIIFVLTSIAPKRNEKGLLADMQEEAIQQEDGAPIVNYIPIKTGVGVSCNKI